MINSRRGVLAGGAAAGLVGLAGGCKPHAIPVGDGRDLLGLPRLIGSLAPLSSRPGLTAEVPNDAEPYIDQIGRGWDTVFEQTRRYFIKGEIVTSAMVPDEVYIPNQLEYSFSENQSQYRSALSMTAKAKGRAGLFKASTSISNAVESASNSYGLHICVVARKVGPTYQLRNGSIGLTDEGKESVRRARYRTHLLRDMGDSYIAGVLPASELFIDLVFETASQSEKSALSASIKGSYGSFASGKATMSHVIESASAHKRFVLTATGINGISRDIKPDDVSALLSEFFAQDSRTIYAIRHYRRSIRELTLNGQSLDWVDLDDLDRRLTFVAAGEACLRYLSDAADDARYVAANPAEFTDETKDRAAADLEAVQLAFQQIQRIGAAAQREFESTGLTTNRFDSRLFDQVMPRLKVYLQKEPPPAPAPAAPAPNRPAPRRTNDGRHNDNDHPRPGRE